MVAEYQKYRAEVYKILGIAFMTPLGKLVLNFLSDGPETVNENLALNLFGSFLLLVIGIIMLQIGFESVMNKNG